MTIERLNQLTQDPSIKFTKKVKDEIRQSASFYGIVVPECTCRNKWFDVLVQIGIAMRKEKNIEETSDTYKFQRPTRALFLGKRFDQTTPIETIQWLEKNYPYVFKIYYKKVK